MKVKEVRKAVKRSRKHAEENYVDTCKEYYNSISDQEVSLESYLTYVDANIIQMMQLQYGMLSFSQIQNAIDLNVARELFDANAALRRALKRMSKNISRQALADPGEN